MLEVSNLCRFYGEFKAVSDVSFNIQKGEIVGLLGHNGAGKTTIMKMLSGYLEPSAGSILINDLDVQEHTKQIQQTLGYLPENLPVYQEMTVADYLDYAAELKGLSGEIKAAEIRRVIRETEIHEKILEPITTLSRGLKQRVGVAQSILGRPSLLILDEPTNGLDPVQTEHMRRLIRELSREATVILSTHIMQEVEAICDRVLIVKAGQLEIDERLETLKISRELDVACDLPPETVQPLLENIQAVSSVSVQSSDSDNEESYYQLRLALADSASLAQTANLVARCLLVADAELYELAPVKRNLESLFSDSRDVGQDGAGKEEVHHAA